MMDPMNLTFNKAGFNPSSKEKPYENVAKSKNHQSITHNPESSTNDSNFDFKIDIMANINDIKPPKTKQGKRQLIDDTSASTNIKSKSDITTPNKKNLIVPKTKNERLDLKSQRINNVRWDFQTN